MSVIWEVITIFFIAVGLSADAFAVSAAVGTTYRHLHIKHAVRMAVFFGLFQAFMPLVGYLAGNTFAQAIESIGHWVAFVLLAIVGGKMIFEAWEITVVEKKHNVESLTVVLALAVATSIDALIVGVTLSLVTTYILEAVIAIGVITFFLSVLGCWLGQKIGHFFEEKLEIAGGFILILIGLKILLTGLPAAQ